MFPDDSRQNESLILYKLIILYMLNTIKIPLSNSQLSDFLLQKNIASYFTVQQSINELQDTGLISGKKVHHTTLYELTPEGERTLDYYVNLIPEDIIGDIRKFSEENKLEFKQQLSVVSTYEPTNKQDYIVRCSLKERDRSILEITLEAPSKELAEKMCDNWQKNHEHLYTHIMQELLKSQ